MVGVPDEEWGERVAAAVVPRAAPPSAHGPDPASPGVAPFSLDDLRAWASSRLAKYKLPTRLAIVDALPRNAMGKVVKVNVRTLFTK